MPKFLRQTKKLLILGADQSVFWEKRVSASLFNYMLRVI